MSEDEIRKAPTNVVGVSMSTYYHTIHLKLYDNCNCQAIPDINRTLVLIHFGEKNRNGRRNTELTSVCMDDMACSVTLKIPLWLSTHFIPGSWTSGLSIE